MMHDLQNVEEGMKVFDRDNHHIGTVDRVKFGEDDPATPEIESAGISPAVEDRRVGITGAIADIFDPDDLPEEVREKLLNQGFLRVNSSGLFASDRYVTPDQIAAVTDDGVTLNVTREELLKRH